MYYARTVLVLPLHKQSPEMKNNPNSSSYCHYLLTPTKGDQSKFQMNIDAKTKCDQTSCLEPRVDSQ